MREGALQLQIEDRQPHLQPGKWQSRERTITPSKTFVTSDNFVIGLSNLYFIQCSVPWVDITYS